MKKILDILSQEVMNAFEAAGYDSDLGRVNISNRPDLCEYQCNGAMAGAKRFKKAPLVIAGEVAGKLAGSSIFKSVEAAAPGFLNLKISEEFLGNYLADMKASVNFGYEGSAKPRKIIVDYGGPNVAKPLHVGHLRSAVIGESIKRILRFAGHEVTGDIHLGDWGLQMGLIIHELMCRKPELPYFDDSFGGEYPEEAPFTISELEEIYPTASAKSKTDEAYRAAAMEATFRLQNGVRGYRALWRHITDVSIADLKKNYATLEVDFDLWKGESDVQDIIPAMVEHLKNEGIAHESEGAWVIDVAEEEDKKEIPPCIVVKSDGASLYATTDIATIKDRMDHIRPDEMIYVVDKRQDMHFVQVFRSVRKIGYVDDSVSLKFLGFGTMNGRDGKPFKTREGGVMRLESLLGDIRDGMFEKIKDNEAMDEAEAKKTASQIALAAVKYGDLSNQASKDYIFDTEKFSSFEGDTGPYILYTIVRIKSILSKYEVQGGELSKAAIREPQNASEKALMMQLTGFAPCIEAAEAELAPHKICAYIYDTANAFNRFYHETRILGEEDETRKSGWIALLVLSRDILEQCIGLLGFEAPERM